MRCFTQAQRAAGHDGSRVHVQADRLVAALPPAAIAPALLGAAVAGLFVGALGASAVLAFCVVLALLLAVAALVRQEVVIALVLFVLFSDAAAVAVHSHGVPASAAAVVPLLLAVPLLDGLLGGRAPVVDRTLLVLVALMCAMTASGVLGREPAIAENELMTFAIEGLLLYFLLLNVVRSGRLLRLALTTVLVAGAFLAAITVLQELTRTFDRPYFGFSGLDIPFLIGQTSEWRATGPVLDPNYYAQLLLPALAIGLVAALRERVPWRRLAAAAMAATILLAIALTGSRGAALAVAAMLAALVWMRYLGARGLLIAAAAIAVTLALSPSYFQRLSTLTLAGATAPSGASGGADSSVRGRVTENLAAAQVFADHPLLGVGPGGFPLYYEEYASRIGIEIHGRRRAGADSGSQSRREAHNIVLGIAADLGITGLALFAAVIGLTLGGLRGARRRWLAAGRPELADGATALLVGLIGYLVAGLFLSLAYDRYFWLIVGLAGAAAVISTADADARD
ncbi:MAG: hypothetical protein QOD69_1558 [Solirubrobacteraceae bacterium]|nr:hypothetical protein [Solirubrobacteraceae bacterium]